jgi:aminopeptidase YwaD
MRSLRNLIFPFLLACSVNLDAQTAAEVIAKLSSSPMQGRGYARNGDLRASRYLAGLMKNAGILPFNGNYRQAFSLDINTFPGAMRLKVNGKSLKPAVDFLPDPASPALSGSFTVRNIPVDAILQDGAKNLLGEAAGELICVNTAQKGLTKQQHTQLREWMLRQVYLNPFRLKGIAEVSADPLIFGTSTRVAVIPWLTLREGAVSDSVQHISVRIDNDWKRNYITHNLAGYIPGTACPDSLVVLSAHYDHLGLMGRGIYFPGANDNASGVAMVLELMRYVAAHPQRFSVACIFFSGEEAGLLGSRYVAEHPMFELDKVKFLVNFDLVGTGVDGIMVVNATEFQQAFERLNRLNLEGGYVKEIRKRGKACNSDHCPFFEKGVPDFYVYTLGGIAAYHNLKDRPETLPLTAFDSLVKLIAEFIGTF